MWEDGFAYFPEDRDAIPREEDITNCSKTINTNDYNYNTDNNKINNKTFSRKFQFLFCNPKISNTFVPDFRVHFMINIQITNLDINYKTR